MSRHFSDRFLRDIVQGCQSVPSFLWCHVAASCRPFHGLGSFLHAVCEYEQVPARKKGVRARFSRRLVRAAADRGTARASCKSQCGVVRKIISADCCDCACELSTGRWRSTGTDLCTALRRSAGAGLQVGDTTAAATSSRSPTRGPRCAPQKIMCCQHDDAGIDAPTPKPHTVTLPPAERHAPTAFSSLSGLDMQGDAHDATAAEAGQSEAGGFHKAAITCY